MEVCIRASIYYTAITKLLEKLYFLLQVLYISKHNECRSDHQVLYFSHDTGWPANVYKYQLVWTSRTCPM